MVNITPRALDMLDDVLVNIRGQLPVLPLDQPEPLLRLVVDVNSVGLALDIPAPDDQVIEWRGHQVLLVGEDVSALLDGASLDAVDTPDGVRLALQAPDIMENGQSDQPFATG